MNRQLFRMNTIWFGQMRGVTVFGDYLDTQPKGDVSVGVMKALGL